jgi:DNA-binding XRE family transcriptional regulator
MQTIEKLIHLSTVAALAAEVERVRRFAETGQILPVTALSVETESESGLKSESSQATLGEPPMSPAPTRSMKEFGGRMTAVRTIAGYNSAESFAKLVGVDPHTYRRYERGEVEPKFEFLVDFSRATRCSLHWLLTGDGEPRLPPQQD